MNSEIEEKLNELNKRETVYVRICNGEISTIFLTIENKKGFYWNNIRDDRGLGSVHFSNHSIYIEPGNEVDINLDESEIIIRWK